MELLSGTWYMLVIPATWEASLGKTVRHDLKNKLRERKKEKHKKRESLCTVDLMGM
jgi:hypothetical protein